MRMTSPESNQFIRQIHPCFVSLLLIACKTLCQFLCIEFCQVCSCFLFPFEMISSRVSEVKLQVHRVTRSTRDCFQIETKRLASLVRTSSTTTTTTTTMIDARQTALFRRALFYDVQPSRMSFDDIDGGDEKGNDIERRWWAASFSLDTRVYTALLGRFSHSFVRDAILSTLSLSLSPSFLRSLLALVLRFAKLRASLMDRLFFLDSSFSLFSSILLSAFPSLSLSLLLSSYLAHPRHFSSSVSLPIFFASLSQIYSRQQKVTSGQFPRR